MTCAPRYEYVQRAPGVAAFSLRFDRDPWAEHPEELLPPLVVTLTVAIDFADLARQLQGIRRLGTRRLLGCVPQPSLATLPPKEGPER